MKAKFIIGLLVILVSFSMQEEPEVTLNVGYAAECFHPGVDMPVSVRTTKEFHKKNELILTATGIALRKSDKPAPDGGLWAHTDYIGRLEPGQETEITITVSFQDRETKKITRLFTRSFNSCGNNK